MADRSGIKVTASDALEFESVAPKARRGGGTIKTLLFVVVAVFVGAGGWAFYGERVLSMFGGVEDEVPTLRADITPIKVRPENPGGLQVPDRDKLVYNRIQNGGSTHTANSAVERLLPPPESPLPMPMSENVLPSQPAPQVASPTIAQTPKVADVTAAKKPDPAPAAPPVPTSLNSLKKQSSTLPVQPNSGPTRLSKATTETSAPRPQPATPVSQKPRQETTVAGKPIVAKPAAPSDKVYRVQLAAARTPEAARKEWDRLRKSNLDVLGDLGLSVTKIDLGGSKGIFYRLRAGPLSGDKQARALCKALAQRKIGCLVVRPGK